ncbi:MAG TPA: ABC transporter ATP-binding protein, partial [Tepidanaerobacteraceae bacterium]|nr:ABC transporter ATP-binding protein [Tepidanaerobacteraceae bacterium]
RLEKPDKGKVYLEGKDVTNAEPNRRNVNTVFQNYALFPHMTVEGNISYSLRLKRLDRARIKETVSKALELVQLVGFEKRMPSELSGGQRQRVAIARAIVNEPRVLLLDEPLGALDLQLRRQMQTELKRLQKHLGITFVYITHDQEEALNMSDRIAVMRDGKFEQIGTPQEVYDQPKTSFVASFVGSANIIYGTVSHVNEDTLVFENKNGIGIAARNKINILKGQKITVAVRTEHISLSRISSKGNATGLMGVVKEKSFAGGLLQIFVNLADGQEIIASRHGIDSLLVPGDNVIVTWAPEKAILVDLEGAQ